MASTAGPPWLLVVLLGVSAQIVLGDDAAQLLDHRWRLAAEPSPRQYPQLPTQSRSMPTDRASRTSGSSLLNQMQQAANRGSPTFTIPPGDYYFTSSFELQNVRNMEVFATGVTFWFSFGDGFKMIDCSNVRWLADASRPFAIDYDPPVVAQGVITRIDPSEISRWVEAQFDPMFPMPNQNMTGNIFTSADVVKVAFWSAATRTMRRPPDGAVNVYLDGSTSTAGAACIGVTGEGCGQRWRIALSGRVEIIKSLAKVGDLVSLNPRIYPHAIELVRSQGLTFEDTHVYSGTNIGVVETKGGGGNTYRRLKITRRPDSPLLMSVNADGFHSNSAAEGATIVDSEIGFTGDDLLNVYSGIGVVVERIDDNTVVFLDRKRSMTLLGRGDQLTFYHKDTFAILGKATLEGVPKPFVWSGTDAIRSVLNSPPHSFGFSPLYTFESDHIFMLKFLTPLPAEVVPNWSLGQSSDKSNHYVSVRNSWLHDSYARASLGKTSFFRAENVLYQRAGGLFVGGIEVNWLEGDLGFQGAVISDNRLEECAPGIVDEARRGDTILQGNIILASSSHSAVPSPPPTPPGASCGLTQPFTQTTTNIHGTGKWCGSLLEPGQWSERRRRWCESHHFMNGEYAARCMLTNVGAITWKCALEWPPHYPCPNGTAPFPPPSPSSPPSPPPPPPSPSPPPPPPSPPSPPSPPPTPPPPPSPPPPPPSPPPQPPSPPPPSHSLSSWQGSLPSPSPPASPNPACGLEQPFTKFKVNIAPRWCSSAVPKAPFSTSRRATCEGQYVGIRSFTSECTYESAGDGDYKCALRWPPHYACDSTSTPFSSHPPPPPPPSLPSRRPSPPPPALAPPPQTCGLNQPFAITKSNIRPKWCPQMVPQGPFNARHRNTCEGLYVGLPQYTSECKYVNIHDGQYKCVLEWPPHYPCDKDEGENVLSSSPPPPPPPFPGPPPQSISGSLNTSGRCGLNQPFTLTKTNLWNSGRWCGQVVSQGAFNSEDRNTCEGFYIGRPDYSAECEYIATSEGKYSCKLHWPPFYPCS